MLIPNADRATIASAKLREYLLSSTHPIGRFKARFFTALGFAADQWAELGEALRVQHLTQDAVAAPPTADGQKFTIHAILNGPTRAVGDRGERLVHPGSRRRASFRHRVPRRGDVNIHSLDVVVLNTDLPAQGLKRGDLGAIVEIYGPDAMDVEFVAASGRTQALVTLKPSDVRAVGDDDLVAVRPSVRLPRDA